MYADWVELNNPFFMGNLSVDFLWGKEIFSFEYSDEWLKTKHLYNLYLGFYSRKQYLRDDKLNLGLFLDFSPDRLGRVLMRRRESIIAKIENRPVRTLFESDFYLVFMIFTDFVDRNRPKKAFFIGIYFVFHTSHKHKKPFKSFNLNGLSIFYRLLS